ncbi:unnamed protein product [Caenorhabditis angaria]|uniref:DUF7774 domain-containing protein n=1 Tax=Caenorhabditis angaria TaxID=860376 RepID=A0A9P1MVQ5_9PELO|nr:unnamed protein product [Caenorhabditis angaria]
MSDRNFKLLQMFNDYLDNNKNLPSAMSSQQNIPDCPVLLNMSEEEKTRITIRKILDEEQEVYEQYQPFRPVLLNEVDYELKWFLKYNPSLNQEQPRESLILGKKLLQLIIKAQLFEAHSFKSDDVRILYCFFTEIKQPPTLKLIEVLDGIFSAALQQICTFSDRVSVMIDYQVREFIRDPNRAKRSILKSMLRHPELIPECWGSEAAQVRWRDGKEIERLRAIEEEKERQIVIAKELEEKEKKEREEKEKEEKEKEEKEKEEKEKEEKEKIKDKKKEEEKEEKKRKKRKRKRRKGEGKS